MTEDQLEKKRKYNREYCRKHRSKVKASFVKFHKSHPGYGKNRFLKERYGISLEQFNQMLVQQGSCCAICGRIIGDKNAHVDHDHMSNKLRELLCTNCNVGLGHFKEDTAILLKAANYLTKWK